jgi:phosphoribosyl-dephospho-CoA transferase
MRPHDLLRLKPGAMLLESEVPTWVAESLALAPFVVVRRGEIRDGRIPVGVRGSTRAQRHPASLHVNDVAEVVTPEAIAASSAWRTYSRGALPAFAALDRVATASAVRNLTWGPGGSVGFELASGMSVVREDSDLDVIVRPTTRHSREDLERFANAVDGSAVRVDIVVEATQGAVALHEWLRSPQRVLIKTASGPQLGAFHW